MNDTAIVSTFFNPRNYKSRKDTYLQFYEFLKECNLHNDFFISEVLFENQDAFIKHKNKIDLKCKSILWHKETALNIMVKNLPNQYSKVILVDTDLIWFNKNWASDISKLLDEFNLIHSFSICRYLTKEYDTDKIGHSYIYNKILKKQGLLLEDEFNPIHIWRGGSVGYKRDYFNKIGLFEKFLIGGGDTPSIESACNDITDLGDYLHNFDLDVTLELVDYVNANKVWINNKYTYYDEEVNHLFHGFMKHRYLYGNRMDIFKTIKFDETFIKNECGLYEFKNDIKQETIESFSKYFGSRNEDIDMFVRFKDTKFYFVEKSQTDDKFMWLPETFSFQFKNVTSVKFYFNKNGNPLTTNHLNVIFNGFNKYYFNENNDLILNFDFTNISSNVIKFYASFFIPSEIDKNSNDSRKLSCILKKVEIKLNNSDTYIDYDLCDILQ